MCIHKRISSVYTRDLLCIHNTLAHALGQGTQALDRCLFGSLAPGVPGPEHAQECCACTRDLVYTQEILLCIHNKCINVASVAMLRSYAKLCETMRNYAKLFETMRNYVKLFETMRNNSKLCETMRNYAKLCRKYATIRETYICECHLLNLY